MRLISCVHSQKHFLGVVRGERALIPQLTDGAPRLYPDMLSLIQAGPPALDELRHWAEGAPDNAGIPLQELELLAPIPRPLKNVMCLGWNYADHAEESAQAFDRPLKLPKHPVVFTKSVTTLNGPYADFAHDKAVSSQIDWEVELGVVIGGGGRRIAVHEALNYVFGYTVINDLSARDLQSRHRQFFIGKSLDGSCPMGPWIVTRDDIPDPQDLELCSRVNAELKQRSNTRHQIFDVAAIISILSQGMTLEPGDIIATGTPSGVGFARNPPQFLQAGDVVECEVEKIGIIRNRIVEEA
jgi:2-keto-4-pentenoate hydratase/2-oxohepta-3-ene-1,7-dioic acid hydratase in catechol pathway